MEEEEIELLTIATIVCQDTCLKNDYKKKMTSEDVNTALVEGTG